jgi:cyanuric acid amidohydrolase
MDDPGDVRGLRELIKDGIIDADKVVAVIGKTEGNGGANDFTRALASLKVAQLLSEYRDENPDEIMERVALVWSGGCEGVISPHMTVFTRSDSSSLTKETPDIRSSFEGEEDQGRLAISVQRTRPLLPEEVGRMAEVEEVAAAVNRALADLGCSGKSVHYVQVKGPLLTPAGIADAMRRGKEVVTADPNRSKVYARGAAALGVAVGLGEVELGELSDHVVGNDMSFYSAVASTSAGGEVRAAEVIVFANSPKANSTFRVGHSFLKDTVDIVGVRTALRSAGLRFDCEPDDDQRLRISAVFAKAEAPLGGVLRGYRTTMYSDADINYERHARAAAGAVISAVTGDSRIFVSGGTEHQAPPGQAPIATIVRVDND